jgi:phage gp36-like protein
MTYSALSDFYAHGLAESVCASLDSDALDDAREAAKDLMDGYFRAATPPIELPLPLSSVSRQIKRIECHIAAWDLINTRGCEPGGEDEDRLRYRYEQAIAWLKSVASGAVQPLPINSDGEPIDADPTTNDAGCAVNTDTARGW